MLKTTFFVRTRGVLACLLASAAMWGADFTFNQASGDWSIPGNWTITNPSTGPSRLPGSGDDVSLTGTQIVTFSDASTRFTIRSLTIPLTSELHITPANDFELSGDLTLNGKLYLENSGGSTALAFTSTAPFIFGSGTIYLGTSGTSGLKLPQAATLTIDGSLTISGDGKIEQPPAVAAIDSAKVTISATRRLTIASGSLNMIGGIGIVNSGILNLESQANLFDGLPYNTRATFVQNPTGRTNWTLGDSAPVPISFTPNVTLNGTLNLIKPPDLFPNKNAVFEFASATSVITYNGSFAVQESAVPVTTTFDVDNITGLTSTGDFIETRDSLSYTFSFKLTKQTISLNQAIVSAQTSTAAINLLATSNAGNSQAPSASPSPENYITYTLTKVGGGTPTSSIVTNTASGVRSQFIPGSTPETVRITAHGARITVGITTYAQAQDVSQDVAIGNPVLVSISPNSGFTYGDVLSATSTPTSTITWTTTNPSVVAINGATATIVGIGTASVTATAAATGALVAGSSTISLGTINRKSAVVTVNNQTRNFGEVNPTNSFSVTGLISGDTNASLGSPTYSGTGVSANLTTGAGDYPINVSFPTSNYTQTFGPQANLRINAALLTQSITFGSQAALTVGATRTLPATSSAGLTITYISSNPAVAAISSGNILTGIAAGSADITATQVGNTTYAFAPSVTQTVMVTTKLAQTITYVINGGAPTSVEVGQGLTLTAASTSLLAITYTSSDPTIATMVGDRFTAVAPGSVTITASQSGDATYNAATSVARTITVIPAGTGGTTASASSSGASGGCGAGGGVALVLGMLALGWRRRS